jgi:hypothetical protein
MCDAQSGELQKPFEQVFEKVCPKISNVGIIIDRGAACIKLDFAGDKG